MKYVILTIIVIYKKNNLYFPIYFWILGIPCHDTDCRDAIFRQKKMLHIMIKDKTCNEEIRSSLMKLK